MTLAPGCRKSQQSEELKNRAGRTGYAAPDQVLQTVSHKLATVYDGKNSLCCGGSLANIHIDPGQRTRISSDAVKAYLSYQPDLLVTACPLCKKTFMKTDTAVPIKDIAEVVAENCQ